LRVRARCVNPTGPKLSVPWGSNAGGIPYDAPGFPRADLADWGLVLDLNLRAPLLALQLALPALTASGGVVVNIASMAGLDTTPYHSPEYGAAKAGHRRLGTGQGDRARTCLTHWHVNPSSLRRTAPAARCALLVNCEEVG